VCEPTTIAAIGLAVSAAGTGVAARGQYQAGKVQDRVNSNNRVMAEYQAQDALRRGEEDAIAAQRKASGLRGAQRTALAANGVDLGVGTPAALVDQTDFFAAADRGTIRDNAAREAWTRRTGASQYGSSGAGMAAAGTLLGSAGQVADRWANYQFRSRYPRGE
jgi:hypothetical protein